MEGNQNQTDAKKEKQYLLIDNYLIDVEGMEYTTFEADDYVCSYSSMEELADSIYNIESKRKNKKMSKEMRKFLKKYCSEPNRRRLEIEKSKQ